MDTQYTNVEILPGKHFILNHLALIKQIKSGTADMTVGAVRGPAEAGGDMAVHFL